MAHVILETSNLSPVIQFNPSKLAIRGCDFREGMVHLVYANAALKEDD